jgi:hypothetical protein
LADVRAATGLLEVRISQLERGELRLAGPRLVKLAAFYKCSAVQLICEMERWCTRNKRPFLGPEDHSGLDVEESLEPGA